MSVTTRVSLLGFLVLACAALAGEPESPKGHEPHPDAPRTPEPVRQTTCPVLAGNPIDPNIHTVYKGKEVYFCCPSCKAAFEAAPEKYVDRLPQFAQAGREAEHEEDAGWARLIVPLGITTLTLLLLTAAAGLFRRRSPRLLLKAHKVLALLTVLAALSHAALVLFLT